MILPFECPYCMEQNSVEIDPSQDVDQQMIQDCEICCQPIELVIQRSTLDDEPSINEEAFNVIAKQDGE